METEGRLRGAVRGLFAESMRPVALPTQWAAERAQRVSAATLLLCVVWIGAALWVATTYPSRPADAPALVTGMLVAAPLASFLAYALSRSRFTMAATAAAATIAAVATLVAAMYQPELAVPLSHLFLFASVLVLGALFLPLRYALAIASLDLTVSLAVPSLIPRASAAALEIPYLFLGVNAMLFAAVAPLRHQDALQMEQALAAAHATREDAHSLRRDNASKDELLQTASHELHSPLSVIFLQLHLLREHSRAAFTPKQERTVQVIERSVRHLATLLDDLLDKARLDAGRLPLAVKPAEVADLVSHATENFDAAARVAGVQLHARSEPATIRADPVRLAQVLDNLVGNAIKYTPRGGSVNVEAVTVGSQICISIADTGPGLSPDQLSRLFQPFARVHDHAGSGPKGSGLGLAISRGLVERHGGKLWAESGGPGQGTRFVFTLPVAGPANERP